MKIKKLSRKISLNKQTISHLNGKQMKYFYGGAVSVLPTCVAQASVCVAGCPSYHPPGVSVDPLVCQCKYPN